MALRFTHVGMWLILVSRSWIWIWWNIILPFSKSLYGILFFCYNIKTKFHAKIWKNIDNTQGENTIVLKPCKLYNYFLLKSTNTGYNILSLQILLFKYDWSYKRFSDYFSSWWFSLQWQDILAGDLISPTCTNIDVHTYLWFMIMFGVTIMLYLKH